MENRTEIVNYIKANPGTTKNKVVIHMDEEKHLCSRLTTLNIIEKDLIPEGVLTDKKVGNSFHHLIFNDNNEFNRIDQKLTEIEKLIDRMYEPLYKSSSYYYLEESKITEKEKRELREFEFYYKLAIDMILQLLLLQTNNTIRAENSRQKLFTRITQVMLKVNMQFYRRMRPVKFLDDVLHPLKSYRDKVAKIIDVTLSNDLISQIESFKSEFLKP
jgi:hypothetical protein